MQLRFHFGIQSEISKYLFYRRIEMYLTIINRNTYTRKIFHLHKERFAAHHFKSFYTQGFSFQFSFD